jgi:hypothetical protein
MAAAGHQHVLDHAQAKREAEVEPNRMRDDLGRKAMAAIERITGNFDMLPDRKFGHPSVNFAVPLEQVGTPFIIQQAACDRLLKAGQSFDDVGAKEAVVSMGQRCSQIVHRRAFPQMAKRERRGSHAAAVERYVRGSRLGPQPVAVRPDTRLAPLAGNEPV